MKNIFQSNEWEKFKLATGYQKSYRVENILILQKNLPFGFSMLYSPMVGDESGIWNLESGINNFLKQIKLISKENNSIFFRLELNIPTTIPNSKFKILNSRFGFKKAFEEMQPEHTLVLDLAKSEEEILTQMKQKGRYNIKVAEKHGVKVRFSDDLAGVKDFYNLYEKTAKRHSISHRQKRYFDGLIEIMSQKGYSRVYTAEATIDGKKVSLASAVIIFSEDKAIYMFGASDDQYKNVMAPYLLHWTIIKDCKEAKYNSYDFFGIAPNDNPKHPWSGVTRFKKQFGGEEISIMGSYDLVFKPLSYQLFKIAEKIRR